MKKIIIMLMIFCMILFNIISVFGVLSNGLIEYIEFQGNITDMTGNYNPVSASPPLYIDSENVLKGKHGNFSVNRYVNANITIMQNMSINLWIFKSPYISCPGSDVEEFICDSNSDFSKYGMILDDYCGTSKIRFYQQAADCTTTMGSEFSNSEMSNGWHMLTITIANGTNKLYKDGYWRAQNNLTGICTTAGSLYLGRAGLYSSNYRYFNGKEDEVGFWNRTLTPNEVLELYNNGTGLDYNTTAGLNGTVINQPNITGRSPYLLNHVISQNRSMLFNISSCTALDGNLTYIWKLDGNIVSNNRNYTFSPTTATNKGFHNLTAICSNYDTLNDSISYNVEVIHDTDVIYWDINDPLSYCKHGDSAYCFIFRNMTDYIRYEDLHSNTLVISSAGDLINSDNAYIDEWDAANVSINILAGLPIALTIGNHDYDNGLTTNRNAGFWSDYFGLNKIPSSLIATDDINEAGQNSINKYYVRTMFNVSYLMMQLEVCPRSSIVTWARNALANFTGYTSIIATHIYLNYNGSISYNNTLYSCDSFTGIGTDYSSGYDLRKNLINVSHNISMVLSSQFIDGAVSSLNGTRADGGPVYQHYYSYNAYTKPHNGDGWLRYYIFSPKDSLIYARTYTPFLDIHNTTAPERFTMNWVFAYSSASNVSSNASNATNVTNTAPILYSYNTMPNVIKPEININFSFVVFDLDNNSINTSIYYYVNNILIENYFLRNITESSVLLNGSYFSMGDSIYLDMVINDTMNFTTEHIVLTIVTPLNSNECPDSLTNVANLFIIVVLTIFLLWASWTRSWIFAVLCVFACFTIGIIFVNCNPVLGIIIIIAGLLNLAYCIFG